MNRLGFLLLPFLAVLPLSAQEEWTFTGFHPWYWLPSQEAWVYVPDSSQYVWTEGGDWVQNPLVPEAVDVAAVFNESPVVIELSTGDGGVIQLTVNLSGTRDGYFNFGSESSLMAYSYKVDAAMARVQMFAELNGDSREGSFSLMLYFSGNDSGRFVLLGNLGFSSCQICEVGGTFTVVSGE